MFLRLARKKRVACLSNGQQAQQKASCAPHNVENPVCFDGTLTEHSCELRSCGHPRPYRQRRSIFDKCARQTHKLLLIDKSAHDTEAVEDAAEARVPTNGIT